jgi:hypothetical protein
MKRTTAAMGAVALATATYFLGRYQVGRSLQNRRSRFDARRLLTLADRVAGAADRVVGAAGPVISSLRR